MSVETELSREPLVKINLRLSSVESLRCGHSYEIYRYVRSETELGRESQEWPLVYETYEINEELSNV